MSNLSVPIDTREVAVTPVFKYITFENVPESERAGAAALKTVEAVEVRFAGSKLYSPVFPVDAMWKRDGARMVTYAERWPEQYRAFLDGADQRAAGTPLEMLKRYGISDAQLSLCRALKVYSIEALSGLEGQALRNLGMAANTLKEMAVSYMADRAKGAGNTAEIDALKAEIAALKASLSPTEPSATQIEAAVKASDDEFANLTDDELKGYIKDRVGQAPRGTPTRETLVSMAREAAAA